MPDAVRLAIGTFTRIPVPVPRTLNRRTARNAMLLAPVIGALLGFILGEAADLISTFLHAPTLVVASLVVAASTWITRALHVDGLADTADALGSGAPAEKALAIARKSDIGPFGVVTLVLTLLIQVSCLAALIPHASLALAIALGTSRLGVTVACSRRIPAARPDGLGATVAGTVPAIGVGVLVILWMALCLVISWRWGSWWAGISAASLGLIAGAYLTRVACRRLGGITGDVLGAVIEVITSTTLVALVVCVTV